MRRKSPNRNKRPSFVPLAILLVAGTASGLACLGLVLGVVDPSHALFLVAPVTAVTGTMLSAYATGDLAGLISSLGLGLVSIQAMLGLLS